MKEKTTIILVTHSNYLDICKIFLELLNVNWGDCPFKIVISITGENKKLDKYQCIYNGACATLPDCLRSVCEKVISDHYLCFLGDAFIVDKLNTEEIVQLLKELIDIGVDYCNLVPSKVGKRKKETFKFRKICKRDIYCHSFVAFLASREFILNEFTVGSTDLDFEEKYLKISVEANDNNEIVKHYILNSNIFHIMPGINKGLWEWEVYKYLYRKYPNININIRAKLSCKENIREKIIKFIQPKLKPKLRFKIKCFLKKYFNMNFTAKY